MIVKEAFVILAINGILLLIVQLALSILIVKNEGLGFWSIGRVFNDALILLLPFKKCNRAKFEKRIVIIGRVLLIICIVNIIVTCYLIRTIGN